MTKPSGRGYRTACQLIGNNSRLGYFNATGLLRVSEYSGLTLDELEGLCREALDNREVRAGVYSELVRRKERREREGKKEKPRAREFRVALARSLGVNQGGSTGSLQTGAAAARPKSPVNIPAQVPPPSRQARTREAHSRPRHRHTPDLGFAPTEEQEEALQAFRTGEDLKINAFAGSGKTSTLALLARDARGAGLYVAFNRACVQDAAERFGSNVTCRTLHATAFKALRSQFKKDKLAGKLNPNIVLGYFPLQPFDCGLSKLSDKQLASLALATFRRFAHSGETDIRTIDLPRFGQIGLLPPAVLRKLTQLIHDLVAAMWQKMCDKNSEMPLGHDGYLKYWALQKPVLGVDFILLDEAQDTNDVVIDLLARQKSQVVYVGDRHQQIYEWRGAVNALEKVSTPIECSLTKSFRFGSGIAKLANVILRRMGEEKQIVGNERVHSTVGAAANPDAIIARSNGAVLAAVMATLESGTTPYVEGGTNDLKKLISGVFDLREKGFSTVPEFFGFTTWEEVVEYSETEYGQELATFVRLVETYGAGPLWHLIKRVAEDPAEAAVTISTTHKAKGREWESVRLEDDYVQAESDEEGKPREPSAEEMRILYVALTRAKTRLQIGEQTARFIGV